MIQELYQQYSIYFYLGIIFVLLWPVYKNLHNRINFMLLGLFILICALQPLFDGSTSGYHVTDREAYSNYVFIILLNGLFSSSCWVGGSNKYHFWLSILTGFIVLYTAIEMLVFYSMVIDKTTPGQFMACFDAGRVAIMGVTAVRVYLLIKATDGYRGDCQRFASNVKADIGRIKRFALPHHKGD